MSRSNDLIILLQGLQKIAKSAASMQSKELKAICKNSSLNEACKNATTKVSEMKPPNVDLSQLPAYAQLVQKQLQALASNFGTLVPPKQSDNLESTNLDLELEFPFNSDELQHTEEKKPVEKSINHDQNSSVKHSIVYPQVDASKPVNQTKKGDIESDKIKKEKSEANIAYTPTEYTEAVQNAAQHLSIDVHAMQQKLGERAKARKVPASRLSRLVSYGGLGAGLAAGALAEVTRRGLGVTQPGRVAGSSPFLTEANAERIVNTLCRVRGAALKLGQMLSIQDSSLIHPQVLEIFERVRQSADFMPRSQVEKVMRHELGDNWRSKLSEFDYTPFAAASIGQVHAGVLHDGRRVAMKLQYPGVAQSINSDINNILALLKYSNILPKGMYAESAIDCAKTELNWEVDYTREAECSEKFRELLRDDPVFRVPEVIHELSTRQLLTTELIDGVALDKTTKLPQAIRSWIGENILRLCISEIFDWKFMQTDPNWANFFYNPSDEKLYLLDFGASREFSSSFVDKYIRIIHGAATNNKEQVLFWSQQSGFLTGYETKAMEDAHCEAVTILGEAFASHEPFNFGNQNTTARIHTLIPVMLEGRLTPPPVETYSLHRKMSGAFLLCSKLGSVVNCRPLFKHVWDEYVFENGEKTDPLP